MQYLGPVLADKDVATKEYVDNNAYVLPPASTAQLGGVKPDGTTITVDEQGRISAAGGAVTTFDPQYSYFACPHNNRVEIKTSGTWTVPANIKGGTVDVFLVGGGGGGSLVQNTAVYVCGGGGGYTKMFKGLAVAAGDAIPITIGARGNVTAYTSAIGNGTDGGFTSFGSLASVAGGSGSRGSGSSGNGGNGGSGGGGGTLKSNLNREIQYPAASNGGSASAPCDIYLGGLGQGYATTDPYSGITYSRGGAGGALSTEINDNPPLFQSPGQYGDGMCNPHYKGGLCVIYYSTEV